jgi:hypothetical protein
MTTTESIDGLTRQQLYEHVWNTPIWHLARRFGLLDRKLRQVCRENQISLPPNGYWTRKRWGKLVEQIPLPEPDKRKQQIVLERRNKPPSEICEIPATVAAHEPHALAQEIPIRVPVELTDPHPLVVSTMQSLRGAKSDEHGYVRPKARGCLDVEVAPASVERAMRLLDALLMALDQQASTGHPHGPALTAVVEINVARTGHLHCAPFLELHLVRREGRESYPPLES